MKIVAKPINTIVVFNESKRPTPYRFKYKDEGGETRDVKVDKIISIDEKKIAGIRTYNYTCLSVIGDIEKVYELKYIIGEARWELYKI